MGKKRKAGGRPAQKDDAPMRTKYSIEERFEDSEDEFQANRDQILLEEAPEAKRRRRVAEDEEILQPSDEEILGYESVDEDEDDLESEDDYDEDDDDMGLSKKARGAESEEEEEGIAAWGSSRKDLYNADQIETEADALEEEQEAKRLQQKQLQAMDEADFGFDESEWAESGNDGQDDAEDTGVVTEVLPQLEITEDMDDDEKRRILSSRYPEFEPLAKEFASLQPIYKDLQKAASKATSTPDEDSDEPQPAPVAVVKLRALSTYLACTLCFSLPLPEGSDADVPLSPAQLRQHPVMGSLVKFRKLWETVKDLEISEVVEVIQKPVKAASSEPTKAEKQPKKTKEVKEVPQKKKLSRAERAAETARAEAEARRAERLRQTEAGLADLDDLVTAPGQKRNTKKSKKSSKEDDESDFGDENALTAREAEEKAKQKRSLRFYTSQLAQKANKRQSAGQNAGGDADIPYRERLKDRQARLNAEAEKRGRQRPDIGEELGGDSDEEDHRVRKELRSGGNQSGTDEDEYYDMVAARSKQRKDDKKARADAYAAAAREGGQVHIQEEVGADGKRAITYQIEKNKGLTPKRSKDSRNPRVKKRKKYEEKKKKLGSIRQVYKGGEARGGYGGELTGIKKNLVKSVKF
ncbi:uncharacterized protein N7473_010684 [Penicillium subrubescens]|uniref:uncharacterized protein n=1 Tax=Penicillium subrubescens TaxID=1316194 RepID=UPI002545A289|nr:uncharacterized protein N7473_010684 [Penicillium subrubescens]KAJ5883798.1 hypothetical protein N7473_010684 [Penicillium subrubescens]